jgi:hypothetical protein
MLLLIGMFAAVPVALAAHVAGGMDVKVTNDSVAVGVGSPNPSFDSQKRQSNETSVAISPANPSIIAVGANDYRMVPVFGDAWLGLYVSTDSGASWFNTMVPGFPSDSSAAGLASPLLGLDGSGDPTVRFDAAGNLYVAGIAFNRDFDQQDLSNDTVVYVAKYTYTPSTVAGTSTQNSAANPPKFTYAFTTIVDKGAVGFAVPVGDPFGFAGKFDDKNWMAIDTNSSGPCSGNIYYTFTKFTGLAGAFPIVFSRSTDGGTTFSEPRPVSQRGQQGTVSTQGSNIAVGSDGRIYVSYRTFATSGDPTFKIQVVRSNDCGGHFGKPVTAATFTPMPRQASGLTFRTPTESWIAVDDTVPNTVYVAFMAMTGAGSTAHADIFVARSTDGGATWGAPAKVNDDVGGAATNKHQFWPTIAVSNGDLHVAWYDFRDSPNAASPSATNSALNVYYASSNTIGVSYPAFSHNVKVTDVPHNPNCLLFGAGTVGFHGDYIELAARWDGTNHIVHLAWADNRDVTDLAACTVSPFLSNDTGHRNQNIYADKLVVAP